MTRTLTLATIALLFALAAVGCGSSDNGPRNDMPTKTITGGVDKKGKQSRTMEASLEDPTAKKR